MPAILRLDMGRSWQALTIYTWSVLYSERKKDTYNVRQALDRIYTRDDPMNARRLTVSCHYPQSRAGRSPLPTAPMPFLRLQGRWLDQAGFAIGANVRVEVAAGRLVVEVIDSAAQPEKQ
jgi:hypothetical protein